MKVVILCGGYATRLYPLTLDKPKALLDINGRPLIDYIIDRIPSEISEIVVVTNNKFFSHFFEWSKNQFRKIKIINDGTMSNESRIGGLGDLMLAVDNTKEDLLVICGDNLFDGNLSEFIAFFNRFRKTSLVIYKSNLEEAKKMGVVEVFGDRLVSFEEKPSNPKSDLVSTGIYLISRDDLGKLKEYMDGDGSKEGLGFFIKYLSNLQEVLCFTFIGRWVDIGSKEIYEAVKNSW